MIAGRASNGVRPGKISTERGFTMIATHNIKVNGQWYKVGEEYEVEELQAVEETVAEQEVIPVDEKPSVEEPKTSPKSKTAGTRRKPSK